MHHSAEFLHRNCFARDWKKASDFSGFVLTYSSAHALAEPLSQDCRNYLFSAAISYCSGLRLLVSKHTTWPIVPLYYSSFYSMRSLLASSDVLVFYTRHAKHTPFVLHRKAGASPKKLSGTTHGVVTKLFCDRFAGTAEVTQLVEGLPAPEWLMNQRELANYRRPRFFEPESNPSIPPPDQLGRRVAAYLSSDGDYLAFDPEHCALAFPLRLLLQALNAASSQGNEPALGIEAIRVIHQLARDERNRPIQPLISKLEASISESV